MTTTAQHTGTDTAPTPTSRPKRRWLRLTALAVLAAVAALSLRGHLPNATDVITVITDADLRWLAAAALAQALSQAAFAFQQRTLLTALGVHVPRRDMLDITYSRSMISMLLPAGAAASAAFALKQYRRHGAATATATAAMLLSAIASIAGLVLLYTTTLGPLGSLMTWTMVAAAAAVAAAAGWFIRRHRSTHPPRPVASPARPSLLRRAAQQVRRAVQEARTIPLRTWIVTTMFAMVNWLLDLTCLLAVAHACDFSLTWHQIATVYLAVQVVRQIPITPGGIGLIEASLLAGFLASGAAEAGAAAVILGYRVMSFWLMIPAGLGAYLRLTRTKDHQDLRVGNL